MKAALRNVQERVEGIARIWEAQLGFDKLGLTVRHRFADSWADAHHTIIAETDYNWEYRDGSIVWYLPRCASLSDRELTEAVIHEYVHCLLASMESCVKDKHSKQCEFAVETMTQAILIATGLRK